jgi:hypothetical protein
MVVLAVACLGTVAAGAGASPGERREVVPTRGVGTTGSRSPSDTPAPAARAPGTQITIAVLPARTTVEELAAVEGMGVGILSAGMGEVPAPQTYLDVSQGARVPEPLYDRPLPPLEVEPDEAPAAARVAPTVWREIRERAESVPADIVPGLLGATLEDARVSVRMAPETGVAVATLVDERGSLLTSPCTDPDCPAVTVVSTHLLDVRRLASDLRGGDLLVAIERAPPEPNHGLAIGIAGSGFDGTLTSDSTRIRGYVVSTDLAPTVLTRLGLPVPDEMTGEPIHVDGAVEAAYVEDLQDRLAVVGPRRAPVIGLSVLIWVGLAALAGLTLRAPGLRVGLAALAVALALVPALLLVCAALQPSELAERLIIGIAAPALALVMLRVVGGLRALAIAGATSVAVYAVDVVAGSHLTALSLVGPNPAGGVRFYGIGNELEATVAALVPIATGAALAGWAPRASARAAAVAFAIAGLIAVAAFAPGRFGADVGAAVAIPVGSVVAIAACVGARRGRLAWLVAVPVAVLAVLVAVDLALGGGAHLTRSILQAGGLDDVADVFQRRLELSARSFERYAQTVTFWVVLALSIAGVARWRVIREWFGRRRAAWAGFLGAVGATLAGTLANDSGALLLMIGAVLAAATAGLAWATRDNGRPRGFSSPAGPVT